MKGWRTLGFNVVVAIANVVVLYNWADIVPAQYLIIVNGVLVPAINGWLRSVTDTPLGKREAE